MILLLKAACLWSCILACVCSHSLCIKLPWPTLLTIRYLIYISIFLLPHRVCCHWLSAMPAQHMKAPEQAREDTSPAKIDVTSKSPVGDISVVTLIRTDTTLDVYGCSSHVRMYALASHLLSASSPSKSLDIQTSLYNGETAVLMLTVGNSSQASCLSRNSAMDGSIGDS